MALRQEAKSKLDGWRAKAINDLICDQDGKLLTQLTCTVSNSTAPDEALVRRVTEAVAIRDDQYNTNYFKISLRRRHLSWLFLTLTAVVLAFLTLSYLGCLPAAFRTFQFVLIAVLLGILGASFSVARNLTSLGLEKKIPEQQIGAVVIWMRPVVGAVAALVSLILFQATKEFNLTGLNLANEAVVLTIAFVSGFSERFIMGPIEKIDADPAKA